MNYTAKLNTSTVFTKVDNRDCGTFHTSQNVRYWRVLRALETSAAGDYVTDARELADAFELVLKGVRDGRIKLSYSPASLLVFDIPPRHDPLYLQAMVFWCAKMRCSLEVLVDAHSTLGNSAPVKDLFMIVSRSRREQLNPHLWEKTLVRDTFTPATVPVPLTGIF